MLLINNSGASALCQPSSLTYASSSLKKLTFSLLVLWSYLSLCAFIVFVSWFDGHTVRLTNGYGKCNSALMQKSRSAILRTRIYTTGRLRVLFQRFDREIVFGIFSKDLVFCLSSKAPNFLHNTMSCLFTS